MTDKELKLLGSVEGLRIKYKDDPMLVEILDGIIDYIYLKQED